MNFNFSGLGGLFEHVDANIKTYLILEGKEYEIEHFFINFSQEIDHKGQPQHETRGGQIDITLTQAPNYSLYDWAKRSGKRKTGEVRFKSESRGTVLEITFEEAYCVNLHRSIKAMEGTRTSLTLAPRRITMNGITHDNHWKY